MNYRSFLVRPTDLIKNNCITTSKNSEATRADFRIQCCYLHAIQVTNNHDGLLISSSQVATSWPTYETRQTFRENVIRPNFL